MAAKGASSTLNTTDTSAATELEPAADAPTRDGPDKQLKYPEGAGKPIFSGTHNRDGYTGGPSADRAAQDDRQGEYVTGEADQPASSSSITAGGDTDSGGGQGHTSGETYRANAAAAETAPNAFANFQPPGTLKPKGANLTEGDIPQTKTFTGDVGGVHDPGRGAEAAMLRANANVAGGGVGSGEGQDEGAGDAGAGGTGRFDVLESERA